MHRQISSGAGLGIIIILAILVGFLVFMNSRVADTDEVVEVSKKEMGDVLPQEQEIALDQEDDEWGIYESEKTGIYFEYPKQLDDQNVLVEEVGDQISIAIPDDEDRLTIYSLNFNRREGEKFDDAIIRLFSNGNDNCIVVKKDISEGVFNEVEFDDENLSGNYDLYSKIGKADKRGCGKHEGGGIAHFIYDEKYPNKIIWVKYGNYNIISAYDPRETQFLNWLNSIRFYK